MVRVSWTLAGHAMLRFFRTLLNTWPARAFFAVLVAAFCLWGIGPVIRDVISNTGSANALATVGGRKIEVPEFQEAFRRDLAQVTRMMGGRNEPTPAIRRTVAEQTLDRLIVQTAIAEQVQHLGIVVPDDALRQSIYAMPMFRGPSGAFDKSVFDSVLRNNNLTEGRFVEMMRAELAQRQLMESVQAGVSTPATLLQAAYAFQHETRVGEVVDLPLSAAAAPPEPSADELQRQYENNPGMYSAPAYRRIKLVVLAPQILARGIDVSDDEIKAYYDQHKGDFNSVEQRAAQVIVAPDETTAKNLAAAWQAGADWAAIQKAAEAAKATATALDPSTRQQFPSPELADAVFAAAPDVVVGPVKSAFGFDVIKVTKVVGGVTKTLDQVKDQIKQRLALDRATDQVDTRANKLDDALSAGTSLDDLPADLGLAALTGTLDAQGDTPTGDPAPIPGTPALRQAILQTAWSAGKGDAPHMIEGPDQSYYALQVEDIIEPKVKPFNEVKAQVREDWIEAQRKHEQDEQAAKLMRAAQVGGSLDDAATIAGLRMDKTPPVARAGAVEHVPPAVQQALFRLKQGETTMIETPEGFAVVRLAQIVDPDPAKDPAGAAEAREAMTRSLGQDVQVVFANALRNGAAWNVNQTLLDNLVQ